MPRCLLIYEIIKGRSRGGLTKCKDLNRAECDVMNIEIGSSSSCEFLIGWRVNEVYSSNLI